MRTNINIHKNNVIQAQEILCDTGARDTNDFDTLNYYGSMLFTTSLAKKLEHILVILISIDTSIIHK